MAWVCALALLQAAYADEPATKMVIVEGVGAGADAALARDQALKDALRQAVNQVLGVYVKSETLVQNSRLVESEILTRSSGFVAGHKVIDESSKVVGNTTQCRINIEAQVWVRQLQNTLAGNCAELRVAGMTRVLIALSGNGAEEASTHLEDRFSNNEDLRDVQLFNESQMQDDVQLLVRKVMAGSSLTAGEVNQLNQQVDLIITGSATVSDAAATDLEFAKGMLSSKGKMIARALWTGTGRVVSSASVIEGGMGGDKEAAKAAATQRAVEAWLQKTLCSIKVALVSPARGCEIKVAGATDISQVQKLLDSLKSLRFTQEARLRSFAAAGSWIDIVYADDIGNLLRELQKAGAKVKDLGNRTVMTTLMSRSA